MGNIGKVLNALWQKKSTNVQNVNVCLTRRERGLSTHRSQKLHLEIPSAESAWTEIVVIPVPLALCSLLTF